MRADEQKLWDSFPRLYATPREAGIALNMNSKRVQYLCLKWAKKRTYEYGVSCDLGWKT